MENINVLSDLNISLVFLCPNSIFMIFKIKIDYSNFILNFRSVGIEFISFYVYIGNFMSIIE